MCTILRAPKITCCVCMCYDFYYYTEQINIWCRQNGEPRVCSVVYISTVVVECVCVCVRACVLVRSRVICVYKCYKVYYCTQQIDWSRQNREPRVCLFVHITTVVLEYVFFCVCVYSRMRIREICVYKYYKVYYCTEQIDRWLRQNGEPSVRSFVNIVP